MERQDLVTMAGGKMTRVSLGVLHFSRSTTVTSPKCDNRCPGWSLTSHWHLPLGSKIRGLGRLTWVQSDLECSSWNLEESSESIWTPQRFKCACWPEVTWEGIQRCIQRLPHFHQMIMCGLVYLKIKDSLDPNKRLSCFFPHDVFEVFLLWDSQTYFSKMLLGSL